VTTLERHCQLLLRAYPAAYREVRGEEIVGTLLEVTPAERSWPLPRDSRGLILGGLRARAAQPRQSSTAANLRVAALAGVAAYLAFSASGFLSSYFPSGFIPDLVQAAVISPRGVAELNAPFGWPLAAVVLSLIPVALVWLSRRRVVVLLGALPAAAATCYAGPWQSIGVGSTVVGLACLAALVALAGYAERPSWFWPLGLLAIAPLLLAVAGRFATSSAGLILVAGLILAALAVTILSIAWMVIDARPAIAMAVFLLASQLSLTISLLAMGDRSVASPLVALVVIAITAVAVWPLRRQSGRGEPA
jgi:hypothetical protein